jgi:hypothetical protein
MTNLTDRIAAVLREHRWFFDRELRKYRCTCGEIYGLQVECELHVAAAIVEELGLTQEKNRYKVCPGAHHKVTDTRYVTEWEPE